MNKLFTFKIKKKIEFAYMRWEVMKCSYIYASFLSNYSYCLYSSEKDIEKTINNYSI